MRIGITCYPSHGGSGVVATELGKLLAEKGHDIHFITYDMPFRLGNFHQNIRYHGVEANRYAVFKYPPYDLSLASRMAQVAKTYDLDLLHVHYAVPHAIAAVLAKQMVGENLKVVTTLHGTDITVLGEDPSLRDIICFGIRQSDAVTAVSEDLAKQTKSLFCQDYERGLTAFTTLLIQGCIIRGMFPTFGKSMWIRMKSCCFTSPIFVPSKGRWM